jgi:hypothetical protein
VTLSVGLGATAAMRAWDGELFYDKEMKIEYAKTRSYATRRIEEPGWDPLAEAKAKALGLGSRLRDSRVKREGEGKFGGSDAKHGQGREEDGEAMEMDDEQEAAPSNAAAAQTQPAQPTCALFWAFGPCWASYIGFVRRPRGYYIFKVDMHEYAARDDDRSVADVVSTVSNQSDYLLTRFDLSKQIPWISFGHTRPCGPDQISAGAIRAARSGCGSQRGSRRICVKERMGNECGVYISAVCIALRRFKTFPCIPHTIRTKCARLARQKKTSPTVPLYYVSNQNQSVIIFS